MCSLVCLCFSWPLGVRVRFLAVEDHPLRKSRRLQNLPPSFIVETPPPPQRQRLDTYHYFEPTGVSEVPSEPKLRLTHEEILPIKIEYICKLVSL